MLRLGSHELTHPELLSEHQLRELLRSSCIDIHKLEKLSKNELLDIYKRIAMPLPQRQRGNAKTLDAEVDMMPEESVKAVKDNNMCSLNTSKGVKRMSQLSQLEEDRLKPLVNDQSSMPKKIRLSSTSKVETACNGINRRRCDEQNEESLMKKRQKITWP